ncbi:hypothetical protein AMJ39_00385 [candidate division TA06 bacterium DG_24]|uniref:Uncharacterized protein n=1 Tax=candidate division TA06 bacterium DG_24 TaxID=1703770 RepID=A0A0S7WW74_UNCT6|nr:MAG: hypothetical protein AMJ39_00385 [candidate division TA06 bacterium DG_24]
MGLFERLMHIDRRIIFLCIALAVLIPFIFPLRLPTYVTRRVKDVYDRIETLTPDDPPVLISIDYDPAAMPELQPMTLAVLRHCFSKDLKVITMTLHQAGPGLALDATSEAAEEYGKVNGIDYVFLGFKPAIAMVIDQMGQDIHRAFPEDYFGTPLSEIPMIADIHTYDDISLIVTFAASAITEAWVAYANGPYQEPVAAGCTAVSATDYYPFLQTGQLFGLIGGLKGAAEYEYLIGVPGRAIIGMDAQSIAHLIIIVFVIIGNVAFFVQRRGAAGGGRRG